MLSLLPPSLRLCGRITRLDCSSVVNTVLSFARAIQWCVCTAKKVGCISAYPSCGKCPFDAMSLIRVNETAVGGYRTANVLFAVEVGEVR